MVFIHKLNRAPLQPFKCQQEGNQNKQRSKQQQRQAYSTAPPRTGQPRISPVTNDPQDRHIQPLQQQHLDDPMLWPQLQQQPDTAPATMQPAQPSATDESRTQYPIPHAPSTNPLRLPAHRRLPAAPPGGQPGNRLQISASYMHPAATSARMQTHRHPPVAPEDPSELLKVLQVMDPPRRRIVAFKGGGYIYAEMEAMIEAAGLGHVVRLTNLMRKAHCIIAKERRDNGKRVNFAEHVAAARNANIPFLLIERLEPEQLVALLRPLLIRKRIVVEHPGRAQPAPAETVEYPGRAQPAPAEAADPST